MKVAQLTTENERLMKSLEDAQSARSAELSSTLESMQPAMLQGVIEASNTMMPSLCSFVATCMASTDRIEAFYTDPIAPVSNSNLTPHLSVGSTPWIRACRGNRLCFVSICAHNCEHVPQSARRVMCMMGSCQSNKGVKQ